MITTRVTELPKPTSSSSKASAIVITTRVTQPLPTTVPTAPTRSTSSSVSDRPASSSLLTKPTTPGIVTVTVTARLPTTTQDGGWGEWPPWTTGGPPWGKGKGGGWGKGKGGRWGRRDRLVAKPEEAW
jgi:hypothetical protein